MGVCIVLPRTHPLDSLLPLSVNAGIKSFHYEAPHQEMTRSNQIQLSTLRIPSPAAYTQDSFSIQNAKAGRLTNAQRKGGDVCTESQSVSCRGVEAVHRALAKTEGKCLNRVGKAVQVVGACNSRWSLWEHIGAI